MKLKLSNVILVIIACCFIDGQSITTKDAVEGEVIAQEEEATCSEADDKDKNMKVAQKRIQKIYKACGEVCKTDMKDERRYLDPKVSKVAKFFQDFQKNKPF